MRRGHSNPGRLRPPAAGFTLIELLVVIAVLSILLAIMLPAMHTARVVAHRTRCASQLRQIATAWHVYLGDNNQQFYQGVFADYDFGGWRGLGSGARSRPLNPYVGVPMEVNAPGDARLFRCPADAGDKDYAPFLAYSYFGNSYRTNPMLIGPSLLSTRAGIPEPVQTLYRAINEHLTHLKADAVCDPARLLLVADRNWATQWSATLRVSGQAWHGQEHRYNMAFFDAHVALTEIHKGVYIDDDYRIQPLKELDSLTHWAQSQMVGQASGSR
jgi:prepilin-type N-terminal cleavage/methylation domain-containing protein/prepilin-type processing-associated H-X9-DG protein